jgi:hypothetical protein
MKRRIAALVLSLGLLGCSDSQTYHAPKAPPLEELMDSTDSLDVVDTTSSSPVAVIPDANDYHRRQIPSIFTGFTPINVNSVWHPHLESESEAKITNDVDPEIAYRGILREGLPGDPFPLNRFQLAEELAIFALKYDQRRVNPTTMFLRDLERAIFYNSSQSPDYLRNDQIGLFPLGTDVQYQQIGGAVLNPVDIPTTSLFGR